MPGYGPSFNALLTLGHFTRSRRDRCKHSNSISGGAFWNEPRPGRVRTNGGHAIAERAKTLLSDFDSTMAEVRRLIRGESERLRIGYLASAVQDILGRLWQCCGAPIRS